MAIILEDAIEVLLNKAKLPKAVRLPIENCYCRVLAEDIAADIDFPPFDRSPLDGYAVRMEDVKHASCLQPVVLKEVDYVPAGTLPSVALETGMATRIMTGAKIPDGADAVIRLEDVSVNQKFISISTSAGAEKSICRQGEEISKGQVILQKGTVLKDGALGLLAMLGKVRPLVYEQPKVAILATGSEVIGAEQPLEQGKIRNSNSYMLLAKVKEAGAIPILLGHVSDDLAEIKRKITGCENIEMVITTGGASIGDYDLMGQLFNQLGIPLFFERLAIKPGMPVMAGYWHNALLIALSGNPASANVSFEVLLRPVLRKMSGANIIERPKTKAKLKKAFNKPSKNRRFVWARCEWSEGLLYVDPMAFQGNGMLSGMLAANALLDIPPDCGCLAKGTDVDVRLLVD